MSEVSAAEPRACTVSDPTPCKEKVALGYMLEQSEVLKIEASELERMAERGSWSREEIHQAMGRFVDTVVAQIPDTEEALFVEVIFCEAFPDDKRCSDLTTE